MNKKGNINFATGIVIGVGFLIITAVIVFFVTASVTTVYDDLEVTESYTETILAAVNSEQTLTKEPATISAQAYSDVWLDLTNTSSIDVDTTQSTGTNISYSIWAKPINTTQPASSALFREISGDKFGVIYFGISGVNPAYRARVRNETTEYSSTSHALNLSIWNHFVLTTNDTQFSVYVNGVLKETIPYTGTLDFGTNLAVGAEGIGLGRGFNGSIDEFRIYNKELSLEEIKAIYNNERQRVEYGLDTFTSPLYVSEPTINGSDVVYGIFSGNVRKSLDNGTTWGGDLSSVIANPCDNALFIDSRGTIFCINGNNNETGNITMSYGNDTNWTYIDNVFQCDNSTGRHQIFTEDDGGNLYVGEYTGGNYDACAFIYKSTDEGFTWSMVYNGTEDTYSGRHIHFVQYDEYNDCIYSAVGDGFSPFDTNTARIIKSCDDGATWSVIKRGGFDSQPIVSEFTSSYRFFGSDKPDNNHILRTSDDSTFEKIYNFTTPLDGQPHTFVKDNNGVLYVGTTILAGNQSLLVSSRDGGETWNVIWNLGTSGTANQGFGAMSEFNSYNQAYWKENINAEVRRFEEYKNDTVYFSFNENSGNVAYDISGNNNNGTIANQTWNNDGVLITLTNATDYSYESDKFTILNSLYSYSALTVSYTWELGRNSVDNFNTNFATGVDNISTKIPQIMLLAIIVVILVILGLLIKNSLVSSVFQESGGL